MAGLEVFHQVCTGLIGEFLDFVLIANPAALPPTGPAIHI